MNSKLQTKTLFRSLAKTIISFLMLCIVSFILFSQIYEYSVIVREYDMAAQRYIGVGTAESTPPKSSDPAFPIPYNEYGEIEQGIDLLGLIEPYKDLYEKLTPEQMNTISTLPYVTSVDIRYMTSGISDEYYRLEDGEHFYSFTSRCVVEATVDSVEIGIGSNPNILGLSELRTLAGTLPWGSDMGAITVTSPTRIPETGYSGWGYTTRRGYIYTKSLIYLADYLENTLIQGDRYVFTLRYDLLAPGNEYYLYDYLAEPWCEAVIPIQGQSGDYLESVQFAPLRQLIEITNTDMHTFDMVYTNDMSSIMRFASGKMAIVDGRLLTDEDSDNGANVCVVSLELANAYDLSIGDTVSFKLGAMLFEQYKNLGAVAIYPERFEQSDREETLEIVGIYANTDGGIGQNQEPNWSYSVNTVFLPKSFLQVSESRLSSHMPTPAEFSLIIGDAWNISSFLEDAEPILSSMGLSLIFDDGGWSDIESTYKEAGQTSILRIIVFIAAVIVAIFISVYLFIGRKKKDFAIMRALGTTKKASAKALVFPFAVVMIPSVLIGSGAAWAYTAGSIARNSSLSAIEGVVVDASMPAWVILSCVFSQLVLAAIIMWIFLMRIGLLSPFELLHGNDGR